MNDSSKQFEVVTVSKSQRKRDADELLDLAKQLLSMPESRLKRMPLDEDLREAVIFGRELRPHGARKRQLMTIGKMLRQRESEALSDAISGQNLQDRKLNAQHHLVEAWRDRLIDADSSSLTTLLEQYPDINAQSLRQLIRNARKEVKLNKPPTAARKIFQILRDSNLKNPLPPLV